MHRGSTQKFTWSGKQAVSQKNPPSQETITSGATMMLDVDTGCHNAQDDTTDGLVAGR